MKPVLTFPPVPCKAVSVDAVIMRQQLPAT